MKKQTKIMKTHAALILMCSLWLYTSHASAVDLAAYEGTCHNVTGNVDGHLKVVFTEEDNKLSGFMSISGWLGGGGNITGTRNETDLRFTTTDHTGLMIKWQGELHNKKLSGEYFRRFATLGG